MILKVNMQTIHTTWYKKAEETVQEHSQKLPTGFYQTTPILWGFQNKELVVKITQHNINNFLIDIFKKPNTMIHQADRGTLANAINYVQNFVNTYNFAYNFENLSLGSTNSLGFTKIENNQWTFFSNSPTYNHFLITQLNYGKEKFEIRVFTNQNTLYQTIKFPTLHQATDWILACHENGILCTPEIIQQDETHYVSKKLDPNSINPKIDPNYYNQLTNNFNFTPVFQSEKIDNLITPEAVLNLENQFVEIMKSAGYDLLATKDLYSDSHRLAWMHFVNWAIPRYNISQDILEAMALHPFTDPGELKKMYENDTCPMGFQVAYTKLLLQNSKSIEKLSSPTVISKLQPADIIHTRGEPISQWVQIVDIQPRPAQLMIIKFKTKTGFPNQICVYKNSTVPKINPKDIPNDLKSVFNLE